MTVDMTPDTHTYDGVPALWNNVPGGMATLSSDQMRIKEALGHFNNYDPIYTYNDIPEHLDDVLDGYDDVYEAISYAAFEWFVDWPASHVVKFGLVFGDYDEVKGDIGDDITPTDWLRYMAVRAVERRLIEAAIDQGKLVV